MGILDDVYGLLERYCEKNPNLLNEIEKEELKQEVKQLIADMNNPRKQFSYPKDILLEFLSYYGIGKSPEEDFASYIIKNYPVDKYPTILDVAAGRTCNLSVRLVQRGYQVTAMDPEIRLTPEDKRWQQLQILKQSFSSDFSVDSYDLIVGNNACPVARNLLQVKEKPVLFTICDTPEAHEFLDIGKEIHSRQEFVSALDGIGAIIKEVLVDGNWLTLVDNSYILKRNREKDEKKGRKEEIR